MHGVGSVKSVTVRSLSLLGSVCAGDHRGLCALHVLRLLPPRHPLRLPHPPARILLPPHRRRRRLAGEMKVFRFGINLRQPCES